DLGVGGHSTLVGFLQAHGAATTSGYLNEVCHLLAQVLKERLVGHGLNGSLCLLRYTLLGLLAALLHRLHKLKHGARPCRGLLLLLWSALHAAVLNHAAKHLVQRGDVNPVLSDQVNQSLGLLLLTAGGQYGGSAHHAVNS